MCQILKRCPCALIAICGCHCVCPSQGFYCAQSQGIQEHDASDDTLLLYGFSAANFIEYIEYWHNIEYWHEYILLLFKLKSSM